MWTNEHFLHHFIQQLPACYVGYHHSPYRWNLRIFGGKRHHERNFTRPQLPGPTTDVQCLFLFLVQIAGIGIVIYTYYEKRKNGLNSDLIVSEKWPIIKEGWPSKESDAWRQTHRSPWLCKTRENWSYGTWSGITKSWSKDSARVRLRSSRFLPKIPSYNSPRSSRFHYKWGQAT